jgi:hypothetical protein
MKPIASRSLTPDEKAVLHAALDKAPSGPPTPDFQERINVLAVVGICECGCRSIFFRAEQAGDYRIADNIGVTTSGQKVDIMVWADGESFAALEIVDYESSGMLPMASSVISYDQRC